MSEFALSASQMFPVGSTIGVFPASAFPGDPTLYSSGAPCAAISTATMNSSGLATFSGLQSNIEYVAGGFVEGQMRYIRFSTHSIAVVGERGETGAEGARGATGAAGSQGSVGAQGATGSTGAQGAAGAAGSTGAQGERGSTGAQGAAGERGATGAQGAAGEKGTTGTAGATGASGAQGEKGVAGATGSGGSAGATGATGGAGAAGATGERGLQGETGPTGAAGATGATGATGASTSFAAAVTGITLTSGTAIQFNPSRQCLVNILATLSGLLGSGIVTITQSATKEGTYVKVGEIPLILATGVSLGEDNDLIPVPSGYWTKATVTGVTVGNVTLAATRWDS